MSGSRGRKGTRWRAGRVETWVPVAEVTPPCTNDPDRWWSSERGGDPTAMAICGRCELRAPCLEASIVQGEGAGVWGGLPGDPRRRMMRDRRVPVRGEK